MPEEKLKLLVLDHDQELIDRITQLIGRHYNIRAVDTAKDGLSLLENDYEPQIILCDQELKYLTGTEFLVESMEYVPDAVRIIMTENPDVGEIIKFINQAHAYLYLRKPFTDLEIIQAVKLAATNYRNNFKEKEKIKELENKIKDLQYEKKNLINQVKQYTFMKAADVEKIKTVEREKQRLNDIIIHNKNHFIHAIKTLFELLPEDSNLFFNDHFKNLSMISIAIAKTMDIENDTISNIILASLLYKFVMRQMPEEFQLIDPIDAEKSEIEEYFTYYNGILNKFSKVQYFGIPALILKQLWEHIDGTGYPNRLSSSDILTEAKIMAVANIYHNNVYRIKPEQKKELIVNGRLTQNHETTRARHDKVIKFLYRKANWFDHEILSNFQNLVKQQIITSLVPELNPMLTIEYKADSDFVQEIVDDYGSFKNVIDKELEQSKTYDGHIKVADKYLKPEDGKFEIDVPVTKLRTGMTTAENVYNKKGFMVIKSETVLNQSKINKIQELESVGMIDGYISIFSSKPKELVMNKELYEDRWRHMRSDEDFGLADKTKTKYKKLGHDD